MADQNARPGAHLVDLVRSTVPPLHPAGTPFVAGAALGTIGARLVLGAIGLKRTGRSVGRLGALATIATAAFFRAPRRVAPTETGAVVAPADGLISLIQDASPPPEVDLDPTPRPRISIFLSILDVHVQRIPVDGVVERVDYRPGAFLSADLDKASEDNERNSIVIRTADGADLVVTQIAGLVARRIVCDTTPGARVQVGDTYGLIRFGSRVDTYLPVGTPILVRRGQRAVGGETLLARVTPPLSG